MEFWRTLPPRGERLLLFLYGPSKLGLTSPVAGPPGRFVVDAGENAVFDNACLATLHPVTLESLNLAESNSVRPDTGAKPAGQSRISTRTLALAIQRMARE